MVQEITINNVTRCRKFGYGISTQPTGRGTDIESPSAPDYTGTLKQIRKQLDDDRRYLDSIQSSYQSRSWFYDGKPIVWVWTIGNLGDEHESNCPSLLDYDDPKYNPHCDCGDGDGYNFGEGWFGGGEAMRDLFEQLSRPLDKEEMEYYKNQQPDRTLKIRLEVAD